MHRRRGEKVNIVAPRGSAKSTVVTMSDVLYSICEGVEQYIILCSDTASQAVKYLEDIKNELEGNVELGRAYPAVVGRGPSWSSEGIITRNGIRVEPLGTGQKIRGRRKHQHRPTYIIVDDPQSDDAAYSEAVRLHDWNWFEKGLLYAGDKKTNYVVCSTLIHKECISARLLSLPGWLQFFWKAITTWPNRMDLWGAWEQLLLDFTLKNKTERALEFYTQHKQEMDEGADVLWPEKESLYELMTQRAGSHASFEHEKQNNTIDPETTEWPISYFEGENLFVEDMPPDCEVVVFGIDPSKGKDDHIGCYQGIIAIGYRDGLLYVESNLKRRPLEDMYADVIELAKRLKPTAIACEADQFQETVGTELQRALIQAHLPTTVIPIHTENVNKIVRIRRLTPYFTQRRVRFCTRNPYLSILLNQLIYFPNAEYNDGPDAMEMAVRLLGLVLFGRAEATEARSRSPTERAQMAQATIVESPPDDLVAIEM
jgi:predicted phage terminase large subunit-like protein